MTTNKNITDPSQAAKRLIRQALRSGILTLPRRVKQALMIAADSAAIVIAGLSSIWIVHGSLEVQHLSAILLVSAVIAVPLFWLVGLYSSIIRYMGVDLFRTGLISTFLVSLALISIDFGTQILSEPIRTGVIFWAFSLILIVGGRYLAQLVLLRANKHRVSVIVYGAGRAGAQLVSILLTGDEYLPVALVDDDKKLWGTRVRGLQVYSPAKLAKLIEKFDVADILLAIPSATRQERRQVLERISEKSVRVQTIPGINDLVSGRAHVADINTVGIDDLLGRDPVPPIERLLTKTIAGKSVMVTGAGGSIGGELCRQILEQKPRRLVCLDISESALYEINKEMRRLGASFGLECEIVALLGSVHHKARMKEAIDVFGVQTLYHAAAYKHVPIVEQNLFEGIHNNVFGTWRTAQAAAEAGVELFVLISTDKAVNPMSVMGATKRMAELVLQAMNRQSGRMRACMVRFGNVLDSSGSVVPLFKEQIRSGGPVTITHKDIIRYFMTIPEAAQLVIQSGAMAHGGEVFVLDMGEAVRIEDLARRMINLMGLTVKDDTRPNGDIEIRYVGLRPAEKLFEELLIGSNVSDTGHPRILRAEEEFIPIDELVEILDELLQASMELDYSRARDLLIRAVKEYRPANGIGDHLWVRRTGTDGDGNENVVPFPRHT